MGQAPRLPVTSGSFEPVQLDSPIVRLVSGISVILGLQPKLGGMAEWEGAAVMTSQVQGLWLSVHDNRPRPQALTAGD